MTDPAKNRAYQAAHRRRAKYRAKGWTRLELWLPPSLHSVVREFVEKLMKDMEDGES